MKKRFIIILVVFQIAVFLLPASSGAQQNKVPSFKSKVLRDFKPPAHILKKSKVKSISMFLPGHKQRTTVRYIEQQGNAIIEGDISLGPVEDLGKPKKTGQVTTSRNTRRINGIGTIQSPLVVSSKASHLWPGGIVPYDGNIPSQIQSAVNTAIGFFNANTNLQFVQRTKEKDHIKFVVDNKIAGSGLSHVGRKGGRQKIKLISSAGSGTVIHEIAHAIGVWHEQSRLDRDSFVQVLRENIQSGQGHNFDKHNKAIIPTSYDFNSVMHYSPNAFGKVDPSTGRRLPTLRSLVVGQPIAPSGTLSPSDIAGINDIYPPNNCGVAPILFEHDNMRGKRLPLNFSYYDLRSNTAKFGDKASSVCVPMGWDVTLFEHSNFRGRQLRLTGPIRIDDLKKNSPDGKNWGDKISSVRVSGVLANPAPTACAASPVVYEHDTFRGRNLLVRKDIVSLHTNKMGDKVSSVCVPAGWSLELFEHKSYRGHVMRVDGPISLTDLKRGSPDNNNWGDMFSSIRVMGPGANALPSACANSPILFQHDNFRGVQFNITNDARDLHQHKFGDKASSLCLPRGWRMTLFAHKDFRGSSLTLTGPTRNSDLKRNKPNGQNWGDRVSSVRIVPPSGTPQFSCTTPTLFEHDRFRGKNFTVTRDHNSLHGYKWGDKTSSICVPANWSIEVFEHTNRGGRRLPLTGPTLAEDLHRAAPDGRVMGR